MKIDFHIHTKKIFSGEAKTRNINYEDFKRKMIACKVGLMAITNHHYFNYEDFKAHKDDSYALLPGMEINIEDPYKDDKKSQLNLIVSEESIEILEEIDRIFPPLNKKNKLREDKVFNFSEFKDFIKGRKVILYVDQKHSKTHMTDKLIEKLKDELPEAIVICDANNIRTHRILQAHSMNSLIGSDIKDWENYESESEMLLFTNWTFNTFEKLYSTLKNKSALDQMIKNSTKQKFQVEITGDKFEIEIFEGLNLIIGDKATGKTEILKDIIEHNKSNAIRTSYFFTEHKEENYKKIMEIQTVLEENKTVLPKILSVINEINQFKFKEYNNPGTFRKLILQKSASEVKLHDIPLSSAINHKYTEVNKLLAAFQNAKEEVLTYSKNQDKEFNEKVVDYNKSSSVFTSFIISHYILKNKMDISKNITDSILKGIREVVMRNTQTISKDLSVGLFGRYQELMEVNAMRNELISIKLKTNQETFMEYEMPGKGKLRLVDQNILMTWNKKITKENRGKHISKDWNKDIFNFSKNKLTTKTIKSFQEYWKQFLEKKNKKEITFEDILIVKRSILNETNQIIAKHSTGERGFFLLMACLNDVDAEYFILDEPSVHLGSNVVMSKINKELMQLRKMGKKIVIATHNANLGINSLPNNFIYRKSKINNSLEMEYDTFFANISSNNFESEKNEKIPFNEIVMDMFEGGKENYEYRKELYENNI